MDQEIIIVKDQIDLEQISKIAEETFIDYVKAVVDLEYNLIGVGGQLHSDIETLLLNNGSKQENLWGVNIHYKLDFPEMIEFDSIINIRPRQNNRSRGVEDLAIQNQIINLAKKIIVK